MQTVVVPDCLQRQEKGFEIYTEDSDSWTELLTLEIAGLSVDRHMESVYEFNSERFVQLKKTGVLLSPWRESYLSPARNFPCSPYRSITGLQEMTGSLG
ncbi:hypothetical protein ACFSQ7_27595 [Paenibacillus rhizoplanae]